VGWERDIRPGGTRGVLETAPRCPRIEEADPLSRVTAQLEVHIEQRRGIKEEDASVGIATAVAGPARHRLCFSGETGHSGEARMHERRDALCAAAEVILLIEGLARKVASTVATVGTVAVEPNSLTAIPGSVELGLDVRSNDPEEAEELVSKIIERGREISSGRGVYLSVRRLSASAAFRRLVQRCEPRARRGHRTRGPKECLRDGNGALA
jgi:acetylornithine deacetylase/succinyl-diaminopimelate desuccinylase-like protein